jgi:hypothetical protein
MTSVNKALRRLQKLSDRYGTLISYATLLGPWPTLEDLKARLRTLNRSDVILRIAWCSAVTQTWATTKDNIRDKHVRNRLFPFFAHQFDGWTAKFGEGFVFSRFTLLWLMRHAFLICPPDGSRLDTPEQMKVFGEACLIANDLSAFQSPKPLPTDLAVAANFIPQTEYFSQEDYDRDIARTLYLLNDLAPNAVGTSLPEFAETLQNLLGYRVTEYCDLAFACAMKPLAAATETTESYQVVALAPGNFATTTITPDAAEQFLNSIAAEEQDFVASLGASGVQATDFTIFRDRPLLRRGVEFIPVDHGFVLDKAGRSLFWTAIKNCPAAQRESLLQRWGELFERYINSLLSASLGGGMFLAGPTFEDGAQASDGAILEAKTLILLEYKANTIRNAVKYADDPAALERVLQSRFVEGEGHGRKGLAQLSHAIKRFAEGHVIIDRSSGIRIDPSDVSKIIPVLVHLDNALRTPGIPHYLATCFKSFGRSKRFTVTPLVALPITELEELEGYLKDKPLSIFLESFMTLLRHERSAVFLTRVLPVLKGKLRKNGATLGRFDQYTREMLRRLFPGEAEAP